MYRCLTIGGSLYRCFPNGGADPLDTVQGLLESGPSSHLTPHPSPHLTRPPHPLQGLLESCTYRLGKETAHDGILQRFVEPREPRDFMVRAIWSPRSAIYEKRTNK